MSVASVLIHSSQFPEQICADLVESWRSRRVNHKFHYDSPKQTLKWLALHEAFSPARSDTSCLEIYEKSFIATSQLVEDKQVQVIGLGCGGGQKDARLLQCLAEQGKQISYAPCDVSVAMVLVAQQVTLPIVGEGKCQPFVFDLATATDLPETFDKSFEFSGTRILSFFGMIPNFEPQEILPCLSSILRPDDFLLFSANLAPGNDYAAGVEKILPQYDNALTKDWLMTFLFDFGVEQGDGKLHFSVEDSPTQTNLKRVTAHFRFQKSKSIKVDQEEFRFAAGETIQLFFSYRYTSDRIAALLAQHGITVLSQWKNASDEEGVFLCRKTS